MLEVLSNWYYRRFSDPQAVVLLLLLVFVFATIYFLGAELGPLFVAIAFAFLFEWPVTKMERRGVPRTLGATIILLLFIGIVLVFLLGVGPLVWNQVVNLVSELPNMFGEVQVYLIELPEQYPGVVNADQIASIAAAVRGKLLAMGDGIISSSLNSLANLVQILIYMILVPLLLFFFLKDKQTLLGGIDRFLPKDRHLADQVWDEMSQQIINYVRGKLIEIVIVGSTSYLVFALMGLNYSALLGLLVGLSVLIPYIGATVVTIPVAIVGLFQWGVTAQFGYLILAYFIIQTLDGNVLVPVLFSEAVNLHPVAIILAVLFFGGIWGFWGVFFAIPLATLVKAVVNAWPNSDMLQESQTTKE